jgi:flagellar biogenesis protein FliO
MMTTTTTTQAISFKQPFTPNHNLINVAFICISLLLLAFILIKRFQKTPLQHASCRVIEKQCLANKTIVYVIEYQQQRFLLADNQHALAIHALSSEVSNESA